MLPKKNITEKNKMTLKSYKMDLEQKYLQAKWVTENPKGYDERDVARANSYCEAYLDGYNQALRIHDVVERSEQLVCEYCNEDAKPTCCDSCLESMVNAVQKAN